MTTLLKYLYFVTCHPLSFVASHPLSKGRWQKGAGQDEKPICSGVAVCPMYRLSRTGFKIGAQLALHAPVPKY